MQFKPLKVNPGLFISDPSDDLPYISPFHQFLSNKLSFGKSQKGEDYTMWKNYPSFLKNTIFYFGTNFDKYRKTEVGYKFFITDELREKGNLRYNK